MIKTFDEKSLQALIDAKIREVKPSKEFYSEIDWDYWIKKYFRAGGSFTIPTSSTQKFSFGVGGVGGLKKLKNIKE